jgi:hypothetical protein
LLNVLLQLANKNGIKKQNKKNITRNALNTKQHIQMPNVMMVNLGLEKNDLMIMAIF